MNPITHLAIAYLAGEGLAAAGAPRLRRGLLVGSVLPDLDLALTLRYPRYVAHRTVGHSLLGISAGAWLLRRWGGFWAVWLGGLTHLLADELNGCDTRRGFWSRQMWLFPLDLLRGRPWRRCLLDVGVIPGPKWRRDLVLEGPVVLLALWVWMRKGRR